MSRTRASAKAAGSRWEQAICDYLVSRGWPHAERRRTNGAYDRGDVAGVAGVVIEAKDAARFDLAGWLAEAETERTNARAALAAVWAKRRGKSSPAEGYVILDGAAFTMLLREAGFQ